VTRQPREGEQAISSNKGADKVALGQLQQPCAACQGFTPSPTTRAWHAATSAMLCFNGRKTFRSLPHAGNPGLASSPHSDCWPFYPGRPATRLRHCSSGHLSSLLSRVSNATPPHQQSVAVGSIEASPARSQACRSGIDGFPKGGFWARRRKNSPSRQSLAPAAQGEPSRCRSHRFTLPAVGAAGLQLPIKVTHSQQGFSIYSGGMI
jgi:hypothetical protein